MAWTTNQQLAIDAEGADILVAAGAGSGKTAVLVERIVREVLERPEPYNVDDLLVLTFTKAAAEEMRSRLYQRMDRMLESADDEAAIKRIYEQQVRLRRANIGTIDSFCKKLLAENVKESGIDDSWAVCDPARSAGLLDEAVAFACEKYSQTDPAGYKRLIDVYGSVFSDSGVARAVTGIVLSAQNAVQPLKWIEKCETEFEAFGSGEDRDFARTPWGRWLLDHLRLKLEALLGELKQLLNRAAALGSNKYVKLLEYDIQALDPLCSVVSAPGVTWEAAFRECSGVSFYAANEKGLFKGIKEPDFDEDEKKQRDNIRDKRNRIIKEVKVKIKAQLFFDDPVSPLSDREQTGGDVRALSALARAAYAQFQAIKAERRLYDYGDMERRSLEILTGPEDERPSELALSYRQKFAEVYVDEYQDTNELQERILDAICGTPGSRGPEAPFRFMVGDVKQSIYGFRGGCPDLFMDKYRNYAVATKLSDIAAANAAGSPGVKILLGENFRSRREIIESVNGVFDSIMNEKTAGMPYGEPEHLVYGAKEKYDATSGDPARPLESPYCTEAVVIEAQDGIDDVELEAHEIAERIKKMVRDHELVLADSDGRTRPVNYGDITILIRDTKKVGGIFADCLRSRGVPVKDTEARYGLFKYPEVRVLTAFLRILDNPLDDIPLLAVLKNIYGFDGGTLAGISLAAKRADNTVPPDSAAPETLYFYDKLRRFADNGPIAAFLDRLEALRALAGRRPVAQTVWECMNENGFAAAVSRQNDGGVGYGNLMRLLKLASGFDDAGRGGFCDFVALLDLYESGEKGGIGAASPEGSASDAVTISTIHKSKGLDYQVVFIARAHAGSDRKEDNQSRLLMHKELGFGPMCLDKVNYKRYPSAMKSAVKMREKADNHAEELRVLYVAMTRAHEKMVITGVKSSARAFLEECAFALDPDHGELPSDYSVINTDNFLKHVCMAAMGKRGGSIALREGQYAAGFAEAVRRQRAEAADGGSPDAAGPGAAGSGAAGDPEMLRFCLPSMPRWDPESVAASAAAAAGSAPAKISVSEVKRLSNAALAAAEEDAGQAFSRTSPADPKQAANAGTLLHCCLEHIDFVRAAAAGAEGIDAARRYAEELVADLTARKFFTEADAKLIRRPVLTGFICSEYVKEVSGAEFLKREIPFTFNCDAAALLNDPAFAGQLTAVQGVIDCVYRAGGRLVLADYKSDFVKDGDYRAHSKRYLPQLSIYAEACRRRFGALPDRIILYYLRDGVSYEVSAAELTRL